jgi:NAD(P)-dependent dehydrogenase (short-subunit alcohol dehydrogenase family)
MKNLTGKTVFITGGLSGIGNACAIAAAKFGANIAIADLKTETNIEGMTEVIKEDPSAIFIECDVSNFAKVQDAIEKVVAHFGSLDIALNNAGIGGEAFVVGDMTEAAWLKVIGINLNGVFNCMKHELVQMTKQKSGVIVNMASILGKVGFATSAHYVAAKHAVIGLTETAALEYASMGIRINAICPGFIVIPMITESAIITDAAIKQHITDLHPMKRMGTAEEISNGFMFLASDESSFVTGTSLVMDGGYLVQ